jgi:hypothetical protein
LLDNPFVVISPAAELQRSTSMVYAMDTLGYAKRLRDAGIPQQQAEAHAEATRDFVMAELVTKSDLQTTKSDLQTAVQTAVQLLEARIDAQSLQIEAQTLRLTVWLGALLAAGIALLAALQKLA